jgi:membrane protease YdiL (CAAX protease family)
MRPLDPAGPTPPSGATPDREAAAPSSPATAAPPGADPAAGPAPAPPARPRARAFLLLQVAVLPVALSAQAVQPAAGLVWTQLFLFALPAAALAGYAGLAPGRFLRLVPPPPRALTLSLLVGAAALLVGGALQALWISLLPDSLTRAFDVARLFQRPPLERAVMLASATVLAPVCEELAFRGHLLSALRQRLGPAAAIALTALAFAALHLDPVRLPGLVFLGVLFGWLTWRSGSVYPAILAHAVNNAAATALALGGDAADQAAAPEPLAAAAVLVAGLALLAPPALAYQRSLPPAPDASEALAPGAGPARRLPRWAVLSAWAAVVSLVLIALTPRR